MSKLKRALGLIETSFFAVGVILGAGIYAIVGEVAAVSGNMIWLSFLLSSFTALLTGFAYAELSSVFPDAGGEFSYLHETIGKRIAYVTGIAVAFCGILGAATISLAFAGYASKLLDLNQTLLSLSIIAILMGINIKGVKHTSTTNIIFTLIEFGGLVFVVWAAFKESSQVSYFELPPEGFKGILTGAALSFFAFTGFEDTVKLAEETREPEKTIPRALFISIGIVFVIYMIVVIAAVRAVPYDILGQSKSPLSTIVEKPFGKTGILIISFIALFSTSNSLLSNMLGASRITYGMAKKLNLKLLSKISDSTRTPVPAIILIAIIASLFSLIGNLKTIALLTNFFVFSTFLLVNIAVIYFRINEKSIPRPFLIPGTIKGIPVIPVIASILILVLIGFTLYNILL